MFKIATNVAPNQMLVCSHFHQPFFPHEFPDSPPHSPSLPSFALCPRSRFFPFLSEIIFITCSAIYASFGGLLMELTGIVAQLKSIEHDQHLYLLIRKIQV